MGADNSSWESISAYLATAGYTLTMPDTNNIGRVTTKQPDGRAEVLSPNSRFNYLVNGGMDFIQRFSPTLSTNTQSLLGRQMNLDNWGLTSFVASGQAGRIDNLTTPIAGSVSRYYAQYKQITSPGKIAITQAVEYRDMAKLRGRTVRFQIKIATGAWGSGSALRMGFIQNNVSATADTIAAGFYGAASANGTDPTNGTNLAYITPILPESSAVTQPTIVGSAMQIANPGANLTFTRYSCCCVVPSNCVNLIVAIWTDSQISANDVLNLAEAQLIDGQEINDWHPMSYEIELARCQRYYEKTFAVDTAPAGNVGVNTGEFKYAAPITTTGTERSPSFILKVVKRIAVTSGHVTFLTPGATTAGQAEDETGTLACSSTTFVAGSDSNFAITAVGNASTAVGNIIGVHMTIEQAI